MEFQEMAQQARDVRTRFAQFEERRYGRSWSPEEVMLGLVGDVGDLSKLVQGKAGVRSTDQINAKLAHELADCMWAVLTLADHYEVDLQTAFSDTMADLHHWLDKSERQDQA